MSLQLQPKDIAACFTLVEIQARIDEILIAIQAAESSIMDQFDDMQARQKVQRQNITELNNSLSVWVKAKNIKTGSDTAVADVISADYIPGRTI